MSQASNYSRTMVLKHLVSGPLYILKKVIEDPNDYLYRLYLYLPFQIKTEIKKKKNIWKHTSGQIDNAIPCHVTCGKLHLTPVRKSEKGK